MLEPAGSNRPRRPV